MPARDPWGEPAEPDRSKPRLHAVVAVVIAALDGEAVLFVRESRTGMIEMPSSWVRGFVSPEEAVESDEACLRRLLSREAGQRMTRVAAYLGAETYPGDVETRFYLCEVELGEPLVAGGSAREAFWGDTSCAGVSNYPWSEVMLRRGLAVARGYVPPAAPTGAIRRARQAARRACWRRRAAAYAPTTPPPSAGADAMPYEQARGLHFLPRVPDDLALLVRLEEERAVPASEPRPVENKRTHPVRRRGAGWILSAVTALLAIDTNDTEGGSDE